MGVSEAVPGRVVGLMTTLGMIPGSSQMTNTAVLPARYVRLVRIRPSQAESHTSPRFTGQSCVSLQRLGVTNEKAGSVPSSRAEANGPAAVLPSGRLSRWQAARSSPPL